MGITIILLLALGLRLIALNQSLWLDEAIEWWAVTSFNLRELLTGYMVGDFNPPLHHILMWFWVRVFGESEIALRLPAVIFGVGTVWWVYKIGQLVSEGDEGSRGGGGGVGLLAAGMAAVNGLLIYYSQEARMYAAAAFFVSGGMYFFMKINKSNKDYKNYKREYLCFLILMGLALYSHYLTWLLLPFLAIWGLRYLAPLVLTMPWWPMLWKQLQAGLSAAGNSVWADLSRTNFKNLALVAVKFVTGRVAWPESMWGEIVVGLLVIGYWVLVGRGAIREIREIGGIGGVRGTRRAIIIFWAFGPVVLGSLIGLIIPVFSYFRFLFAAPAVMILAAFGVNQLGRFGKFVKLGVLGAMLVFSGWYLLIPGNHREDWRGAVEELRRQDEKPVVMIHPAVKPPFDYYDRGESIVIPLRIHLAWRQGESSSLWYIPYAQAIFDPEDSVRKELLEGGYVRTFERHFRGVTLEGWENEIATSRQRRASQ